MKNFLITFAAVLGLFAVTQAEAASIPTPCGASGVCKNIEFARPGGKSLKLDIYTPTNSAGPWIPILMIHGGGWGAGSKEDCPVFDLPSFTAAGYAPVCIDYRLTSEGYTFPAQIFDAKASVRWLRANGAKYNLRTDVVATLGGSAGGHLSALLGTSNGVAELEGAQLGNAGYSSSVQAAVTLFGPTFLYPMTVAAPNPNFWGAYTAFVGGTPDGTNAATAVAVAASPVMYVDKTDAPSYLLYGTHDDVVPFYHGTLLNNLSKQAGADSTIYLYSTETAATHEPNNHEALPADGIPKAIAFLNRVLKNASVPTPASVATAPAATKITGIKFTGSASCSGYAGTLSWDAVPGATSYNIRLDNKANPFGTAGQSCGQIGTPGDICKDGVKGTSASGLTLAPSAEYAVWVDAPAAGLTGGITMQTPPLPSSCSQTVTSTASTATAQTSTQNPTPTPTPVISQTVSTTTSVTATAPAKPTASLTVAPLTITASGSALVSWTSSNATACGVSVNNGAFQKLSVSGSTTVKGVPAGSYAIRLICTGPGGVAYNTKTLTVK